MSRQAGRAVVTGGHCGVRVPPADPAPPLKWQDAVPPEACGLRLCKMVGEDFRLFEACIFPEGRGAVLKILARAEISGHVGGALLDETDFWADIMVSPDTWTDSVRLDRGSWNSLKNHWMRCREVRHEG